MKDFPPTPQLKSITDYTSEEVIFLLTHICNQIYISRNISMNKEIFLDQLGKIDKLFRTQDGH